MFGGKSRNNLKLKKASCLIHKHFEVFQWNGWCTYIEEHKMILYEFEFHTYRLLENYEREKSNRNK